MEAIEKHAEKVIAELRRIAGTSDTVMSWQLTDNDFPTFLARVLGSKSNFPQSAQATALKKLRDLGYIKMSKGVYTIMGVQSEKRKTNEVR